MTTRELIQSELAKVPEERLDDLYGVIRSSVASPPAGGNGGIMAKLREIRIEGPADFAANLDQYVSGEKRVAENLP